MAGALVYHPKLTGDKLLPNVFQTHPSGSGAFYSVYECADSNWVQLGCVHVGFIATAATVMGIKEVIDEPQFNRGRPPQDTEADRELRAIVAQVIRTKPYAAWARLFEEADVPSPRRVPLRKAWTTPRSRPTPWSSSYRTPRLVP